MFKIVVCASLIKVHIFQSADSRHERPIKVHIFFRPLVYHAVTVNVKSLSAHLHDFIHRSLTILI